MRDQASPQVHKTAHSITLTIDLNSNDFNKSHYRDCHISKRKTKNVLYRVQPTHQSTCHGDDARDDDVKTPGDDSTR